MGSGFVDQSMVLLGELSGYLWNDINTQKYKTQTSTVDHLTITLRYIIYIITLCDEAHDNQYTTEDS